MVVIKLGRMLIHQLPRKLNNSPALTRCNRLAGRCFLGCSLCVSFNFSLNIGLSIDFNSGLHTGLAVHQRGHLRVLGEEVGNTTRPDGLPIHGIASGEFPARANLDSVKKSQRKGLAVVADKVVGGPLRPHVVDDHFAGLPNGFVIESSRPDLKRLPLSPLEDLVDVNDV